MGEFKRFVEQIGSLWALILAGGVLTPIIVIFAGLSPQGRFYSVLDVSMVSGFLALVTVLNIWVFGRGVSAVTAKRIFALVSMFALLALLLHFWAVSTFQIEHDGRKFIAGCQWTDDARSVAAALNKTVPDECPGDYGVLLEQGAGPQDIWTARSMQQMELGLFAIWAAITMLWVAMVAFFAVGFLMAKPRGGATP